MWTLFKIIVRVRGRGLLRLRPASSTLRVDCLGESCGKCCGVMGGGVVLTDAEARRIGPKFVTIGKAGSTLRSTGTSCCLLENSRCNRYEIRPRGCRDYPWYSVGGRLYYDAGCPGIKRDRDERPKPADIRAIDSYLPGLPAFFRPSVMAILTRW